MRNTPVLLVSATRGSEEQFQKTPLGLSLNNLTICGRLKPAIVVNNKIGLPAVYNYFINEVIRDTFIVFVHDDVWINDFLLIDHLQMALEQFDVVGVVGNTRPHPNNAQAWHTNLKGEMDVGHLSGGICVCKDEFDPGKQFFNHYGPSYAPASLLDGVFIAARGNALLDSGVRFDERFDFHFYDLDFTRTANQAGLRVATWPIAITHVISENNGFETPDWQRNRTAYFHKWLGPDHPLAQPPFIKD